MTPAHVAFLKKLSIKAPLTAGVLESYWMQGKSYYIDSRVDIRGMRREFNRLNQEVNKP